jgi:hypothetical protein
MQAVAVAVLKTMPQDSVVQAVAVTAVDTQIYQHTQRLLQVLLIQVLAVAVVIRQPLLVVQAWSLFVMLEHNELPVGQLHRQVVTPYIHSHHPIRLHHDRRTQTPSRYVSERRIDAL